MIDFGRQRALRIAVCAKIFHRTGTIAANNVNAKYQAHREKISLQKRAGGELPPPQKPLFHRAFFNFCMARANEHHALFIHAFNFVFARAIALQRVARRSHTRFVKR
ncbi:MAG TPA: hypothetical protein VIV34_06870 [Pseudolabrys sp.]